MSMTKVPRIFTSLDIIETSRKTQTLVMKVMQESVDNASDVLGDKAGLSFMTMEITKAVVGAFGIELVSQLGMKGEKDMYEEYEMEVN